jgi:ATP-dependent protease ClpP protease subunit
MHMERDKFLSPSEALRFGIIDKILAHPELNKDEKK